MEGQDNAAGPRPLNLGPFILRIAGWPIETCNELRSPRLAQAVGCWLRREEELRLAAVRLSESLYALVPTISDQALRSSLLAYRRRIFRSADPVPDALSRPLLAPGLLPPHVQESIRSDGNARALLAAGRQALKAQYDAALAAEREALRRIAGGPLFRKALCLASPATFQALAAEAGRPQRQKLAKLDLTLYSYAMRAAGRGTPNGLWAGVVLETLPPDPEPESRNLFDHPDGPSLREARQPAGWGGEGAGGPVRAEPAWPGRVCFSPDLAPFVAALQAMARRDPWRKQIPLRLNPSFHKVDTSTWQFDDFRQGGWQVFRVGDHPCLAALPATFAAGPQLAGGIRDYLVAAQAAPSPVEAENLVDQMLDLGILWPAAGLPGLYEDPFAALKGAAQGIPHDEKPHWDARVAGLEDLCRRLNSDFWTLSPAGLHKALADARRLVNSLLARYDLAPVPDDANVLLADRLGPWRFSIAAGLRTAIEGALRACWTFDRYGLGEVQAAADRRREFAEVQAGRDLPLAEFMRRHAAAEAQAYAGQARAVADGPEAPVPLACELPSPLDPWEAILERIDALDLRAEAEKAFRRWHAELAPVAGLGRHCLGPGAGDTRSPLSPGSALMLLDAPAAGPVLRIGSLMFDPCLFYSRFSRLFNGDNQGSDPFMDWYRRSLQEIERRFPGLQFADLSVHGGTNQNAASRPGMTSRSLDGLDRDDPLISCARIRASAAGRPRLYVPGQARAVLPALHSAIATDDVDPYTRCLHAVWRLLGRPSLVRPLPRFSAEISEWNHLPRLSVDENAVISPERWTPPIEVAEELASLSGLDRYVAWRRLVRAAGLPAHVYGQYGLHQTLTLMATDSVLAVEHLGQALAAHGGPFLLQEAYPSPYDSWLRGPDGCHYVAELAVAWQGEDTFWRSYLDDPDGLPGYASGSRASAPKTEAETAQPITRARAWGGRQ